MRISKRSTGWAASLGAGLLAGWSVRAVWRAVTREEPPSDREDLSRSTWQVTVFAGVLAAVTAIAQTLAQRQAMVEKEAKEAKALAETEP